jgi:hypothetical protein
MAKMVNLDVDFRLFFIMAKAVNLDVDLRGYFRLFSIRTNVGNLEEY